MLKRSALLFVFLACVAPSFGVERGEPLLRGATLGLQLSSTDGKVIATTIMPGASGESLKMKPGDQLVEVNGVKISVPADIGTAMRGMKEGTPLKLIIKRGEETLTLQGPAKSRPKQTEEGHTVIYDQVKVGDRRIRVIVTHPNGPGPHPTVFLIGGIGAYSVDANFSTMPYGTVMGPVARAGYATIRIDKPGQGDSEGPVYTELLFEDEAKAYLQALRLAKTLKPIDPKRIVIFGHSMGGTFGPIVANQEPIQGLAVNGTLAKTWVEYQLENTRRQIVLGGTPAGPADEFMKGFAKVNHFLFSEGWTVDEIRTKRPDLAESLASVVPDGKTYSGVGIPFFQQLAKRNLGEEWSKITIPTLVTYGANDFISTEADHELIRDIVNRGGKTLATYVKLPESDHGFNKTTSPLDSLQKWGRPGAVHNPNIATTLIEWLNRLNNR